ncbi:type III secretion system export apparatus subunit SctS [Pseudoxanthomonas sp. UTMC 1351]|uniref:type III secretion system export apparatus subunit SctS n=1 Tax=Pseudoxanthomonas sp. UTMC 1351 TaxID=2695853 RepID=UPI0034CD641F
MELILSAGNKTLYLILLLSAAPVIVATLVGLIVGLFQTVTQLQEQTLPYGLKLLSVVVCLIVLMGWMTGQMLEFADFAMQQALSPRS